MRNFFRRWIRNGHALDKKQHGDRIKAFFIIKQYMKKSLMGADGQVADAFFKIYMLAIKFRNNKLLNAAAGFGKGSVTV